MRKNGRQESQTVENFFPYVAYMLRSKNSDIQKATYPILNVIAAGAQLTNDVINASILTILENMDDFAVEDAATCVSSLLEYLEPENKSFDNVVEKMMNHDGFWQHTIENASKKALQHLVHKVVLYRLQNGHTEPLPGVKFSTIVVEQEISEDEKSKFLKEVIIIIEDTKMVNKQVVLDLQFGLKNLPKEVLVWTKSALPLHILDSSKTKYDWTSLLESSRQYNGGHLHEEKSKQKRRLSSGPKERLKLELPETLKVLSFLDYKASNDCKAYRFYFAKDIQTIHNFSDVLKIKNVNTRLLGVSLLVSVMTDSFLDSLVRIRAAEILSDSISSDIGNKIPDYQALVPALMTVLRDPSTNLRRAVTALFGSLDTHYKKVDSGKEVKVLGYETIYGKEKSVDLTWLSWEEASSLVSMITKRSEEYVVDSEAICSTIKQYFEGSKKKKSSNSIWAVLAFLCSHAITCEIPFVKFGLLTILNSIDGLSKPGLAKANALLPLLEKAYKEEQVVDDIEALELTKIITDPRSKTGIRALIGSIKLGSEVLASAARVRIGELWADIEESVQNELITGLLDISLSENNNFSARARSTISGLKISSDSFLPLLQGVHVATPISTPESALNRRKEIKPPSAALANVADTQVSSDIEESLRRLSLIVEIIEQNINKNAHILLSPLFQLLSEVLTLEAGVKINVDYLKQLLLSTILAIIRETDSSADLTSKPIRVETIIRCIRMSSSYQIHKQALLILAALAERSPNMVLNGVMPIFTFMGSGLSRRDDSSSASTIERVLRTVVPPLVKQKPSALGRKKQFPAAEVIFGFTNNFEYIPKHRTLPLFKTMLEVLNDEESSFQIIVLLLIPSKIVSHGGQSRQDLAVQLCTFMKPETVWKIVYSIGRLLLQSPTANSYSFDFLQADFFNGITTETLNPRLLQFVQASSLPKKVEENKDTHELYSSTVETYLQLKQKEENPGVKMQAQKALQTIIKNLSLTHYSSILSSLLLRKDANPGMVSDALLLLQTKFDVSDHDNDEAKENIFTVMHSIQKLLENNPDPKLRASGFSCLVSLSETFGKKATVCISEQMPVVLGDNGLKDSNKEVQISSLHALNRILVVMGKKASGWLPEVIPAIEIMFNSTDDSEQGHKIESACWMILATLFKNIPESMSPYLGNITRILLESTVTSLDPENAKQKLRFLTYFSKNGDTEAIMRSLINSGDLAIEEGPRSVSELCDMLTLSLDSASRETVSLVSEDLWTLMLKIMDAPLNNTYSKQARKKLESKCTATIISFVLKLNDVTFRPLFKRLVVWAFEFPDEDRTNRTKVFYKLFNALLDKLKSVITAYYAFVLDHTVAVLKSTSSEMPWQFWLSVLGSLEKSFSFDRENFWQLSTRFDKISPVLLDQLDFAASKAPNVKLIPTITALMGISNTEDRQKAIQNGVLARMKHENSRVRIAAIETEINLFETHEEIMVSMLPQSMPAISEAMDDDDEDVIRAIHKLVYIVEEKIGESLQDYLAL